MQNKTLVIAHRGASKLVKFENTLEAFQKAIDIGADMAEFDVRRTIDNCLVTYHDSSIEGVKISTLTYNDMQKLALQKGFRVPLIEEVLSLCSGKIKLDIELKEGGYEKELIDLVKKYYTYDAFFMKSFDDKIVSTIKSIDDKITAGLLVGKKVKKGDILTRLTEVFPGYRISKAKADFISPNYRLMILCFKWRMKLLGKPVYPWTVNNKKNMKRLMEQNVDGVITDRPDLALDIRKNAID